MKVKMSLVSCTCLLFLVNVSCVERSKTDKIEEIATAYYETFQLRKDFQKFLSFYHDDVILEDIVNGDKIEGKRALTAFFDWQNPNFHKSDAVTLVIDHQVFDETTVVTKGYFTPFKWGEHSFEAMHFTTILIFNTSGKIIKQIDWINYPSGLVDYSKRKNSNDWIK
ncbi:nuclear transport factor 2 family protein [Spongiimicrobium sp. 3-5]|uniref:nuclear transport factor 2 family protein n=1 Tax=Spongiimicrobium sp. 3-5 TaxID=3332596 RepID=UPI00398024C9